MKEKIFSCELDPEVSTVLKVFLYKNVKNTDELRTKLISGQLKCCIIKSSNIVSPFQISIAANKAMLAFKRNTMTTRNVYSEILFNLSLSKNITQSLTKFGIDNKESSLLVVILQQDEEDLVSQIIESIDGEQCNIDDLHQYSDYKLIDKTYKIQSLDDLDKLTDIVTSKMVTKDFVSY